MHASLRGVSGAAVTTGRPDPVAVADSLRRMSEPVATPKSFNEDLRDLLEAVRTADLSEVDLAPMAAQVRDLTAAVEPHVVPGPRMQAGLEIGGFLDRQDSSASGKPEEAQDSGRVGMPPRRITDSHGAAVAMMPYSPYTGALNPLSPPVRLEVVDVDGRPEVHGSVSFRDTFNGPPSGVHGGVIAAVLDEALGMACLAVGRGGFTGTLTVRYRRPTPLNRLVTIRGWIERTEGRKTFAKGTFCDGDTLLVSAEGVFITA